MSRNENFQLDKDATTLNVFDKMNYDGKAFDDVEYDRNLETFTAASMPTSEFYFIDLLTADLLK